jgi:hypothetical protein
LGKDTYSIKLAQILDSAGELSCGTSQAGHIAPGREELGYPINVIFLYFNAP